MFPVLFSIGSFNFYSLAFLIAVGFLLASFSCWRRLRNLGLPEEKIIDLLLVSAFWGFIISRLGYIFGHFKEFGFFISRWILIGHYPGLTLWGVVIGLVLTLARFCQKNGWQFWKLADELTYSFLPFFVLVQIGCFFDGSLKGTPTSLPWGIFSPGDFIRRQPLAAYNSLFYLLIGIFLLRIERRWRSWSWYKSSAEGFISLIFLFLSLLFTFWVAFLEEGELYYLWFKKIVSILGLLTALIIFYRRSGIRINLRKKLK